MRIEATVSESTELALRRIAALIRPGVGQERAVSTAVTIAEARIDEIVANLVALDRDGRSTFGDFLLSKAPNFTQSWRVRLEVLTRGFGIDLAQVTVDRMLLVVDVRNAMAHGNGRLTPMQQRSWSTALELRTGLKKHLHLTVDSRAVALDHRTGRAALAFVRDFLVSVDQGAQAVSLFPGQRDSRV